jgi:hypothetical protein
MNQRKIQKDSTILVVVIACAATLKERKSGGDFSGEMPVGVGSAGGFRALHDGHSATRSVDKAATLPSSNQKVRRGLSVLNTNSPVVIRSAKLSTSSVEGLQTRGSSPRSTRGMRENRIASTRPPEMLAPLLLSYPPYSTRRRTGLCRCRRCRSLTYHRPTDPPPTHPDWNASPFNTTSHGDVRKSTEKDGEEDDDDEVFFGNVGLSERKKASVVRGSRRRTVLIPVRDSSVSSSSSSSASSFPFATLSRSISHRPLCSRTHTLYTYMGNGVYTSTAAARHVTAAGGVCVCVCVCHVARQGRARASLVLTHSPMPFTWPTIYPLRRILPCYP